MSEIVSSAPHMAVAFAAAMAAVMGLAAMLHLGRGREQSLLPYIFYAVFFVVAFQVVLSGRDYHLLSDPGLTDAAMHPLALWMNRAASLFLVVAAVERIARRFVSAESGTNVPVILLLAFGLYFLTNSLTPAFFGAHPYVSHELLYAPLAICAALLFTRSEGDLAIRSARNALLLFLAASALLAVVRPGSVFRTHYEGVLPGLDLRYVGLAWHANALGPLCVVFLLCLWTRPFSARIWNALAWALGAGSLILTQSKTAWAAFLLCAFCVATFRLWVTTGRALSEPGRSVGAASAWLLLMVVVGGAGTALALGPVQDAALAFMRTSVGEGLLTLTGRNFLWEVAVQEWRSDPVFGYGLTAWNEVHRSQLGIRWAHHAHNQFYQTLSMAGIVGLTGLALYVMTLAWFAIRTARESQGLSVALLALILVRSISEVPLAIGSNGLDLMVHLLLVMVIASSLSQRHARAATAREAPPAAAGLHLRCAVR